MTEDCRACYYLDPNECVGCDGMLARQRIERGGEMVSEFLIVTGVTLVVFAAAIGLLIWAAMGSWKGDEG